MSDLRPMRHDEHSEVHGLLGAQDLVHDTLRDRTGPLPPIAALMRRWPLAIVLAAAAAAGGVAYGDWLPVTYTAEARVAVGAGNLSSGAIAGFPLAATQLASNYSRYVNDRGLAGGLPASLAASPIPQSNVIRIEGTSGSPDASVTTVAQAARDLIKQVNKGPGKASDLLPEVTSLSGAAATAKVQEDAAQAEVTRLSRLQRTSAVDLQAAQAQLASATAQVTVTQLELETATARYQAQQAASADANLVLINESRVVSDDQGAHRQRYGLLGAVAGLLLALLAAVGLERRRERRRSPGRRSRSQLDNLR